MAVNKELRVEITGKDKLSPVLGRIKTGLHRIKAAAKGLGRGIASGMRFASVGAAALAGGLALSIRAAIKQENAEKKLGAVLRATGGAAGISAKAMKEYAAELERTTVYGDEAVIDMQAMLATFKEIKGANFNSATDAILDMSAVLGQDLKSSAIQVGKALNDPIKGVTALSRVGVSFTEGQKELIKSLAEGGDVAGAQAVILKELRSEFGGAARAARTTLGGSLSFLKNQMGSVLEAFGQAADEGLDLRGMFNKIGEGAAKFASEVGDKVVPKLEGLREIITGIFEGGDARSAGIERLKAGFSGLGEGIANTAGKMLLTYAPAIGSAIGKAVREGATSVGRGAGERSVAVDEAIKAGEISGMRGWIAKNSVTGLGKFALTKEQKAGVSQRQKEIQQLNLSQQGRNLASTFASQSGFQKAGKAFFGTKANPLVVQEVAPQGASKQ